MIHEEDYKFKIATYRLVGSGKYFKDYSHNIEDLWAPYKSTGNSTAVIYDCHEDKFVAEKKASGGGQIFSLFKDYMAELKEWCR